MGRLSLRWRRGGVRRLRRGTRRLCLLRLRLRRRMRLLLRLRRRMRRLRLLRLRSRVWLLRRRRRGMALRLRRRLMLRRWLRDRLPRRFGRMLRLVHLWRLRMLGRRLRRRLLPRRLGRLGQFGPRLLLRRRHWRMIGLDGWRSVRLRRGLLLSRRLAGLGGLRRCRAGPAPFSSGGAAPWRGASAGKACLVVSVTGTVGRVAANFGPGAAGA